MTMITPSYLGETIEYSSLHACRSTLEDPTLRNESRSRRRFISTSKLVCCSGENSSIAGTRAAQKDAWKIECASRLVGWPAYPRVRTVQRGSGASKVDAAFPQRTWAR